MPRPARLSLDMMETLITLVDLQGDATLAAEALGINQPSMSKRLSIIQHSNPLAKYPWIEKNGKTWKLTSEGQRNLQAIRDIVRMTHRLQEDLDLRVERAPEVSIACGQLAVETFVRDALLKLRAKYPEILVRVGTPRGKERILGVATGVYDMAIVTHDPAEILRIAKRPLQIEQLFHDPWVLVCGKKASKQLREKFQSIPDIVELKHLVGLDLVLPEQDSGLRTQMDQAFHQAGIANKLVVPIEIGGWNSLLQYVVDGWGVGLVSQSSVSKDLGLLPMKIVQPRQLEPSTVHLILRNSEELSEKQQILKELLISRK